MPPVSKDPSEELSPSLTHFKAITNDPESIKKRKSKSPGITKDTKKFKAETNSNLNLYYGSSLINNHKYSEESETPDEIATQYKKFSNSSKFNLNSEEVFCICRKPDHGGELMVLCDGCEEWFHFKCMKLNKQYSKLISRFYCKFCRWKNLGDTQWKRKCRLPSCWEPIRSDSKSKYCTDDHGLLYLKQQLLTRDKSIGDIKSEEMKSVINYVNEDYDKLVTLGSKFPELPEIIDLKNSKSKDYSKFPEYINNELSNKINNIDQINGLIELCQLKSQYLLRLKEKIKIINDKINYFDGEQTNNEKEMQETSYNSKKSRAKKSNKSKKCDVCFYDKTLSSDLDKNSKPILQKLISSKEIYEDFKQEIDSFTDFYRTNMNDIDRNLLFQNRLCLQDRKKCMKHSGWWNLINDRLFKYTSELTSTLQSLEDEKFIILRDYTIRIYEEGR